MHGLKFTDYNDIEVYIEPNGDFTCRMGEGFMREVTFERLKLRIENEMKATATAIKLDLPCSCLIAHDGIHTVMDLSLVGINRSNSALRWSGFSGEVAICSPGYH